MLALIFKKSITISASAPGDEPVRKNEVRTMSAFLHCPFLANQRRKCKIHQRTAGELHTNIAAVLTYARFLQANKCFVLKSTNFLQ